MLNPISRPLESATPFCIGLTGGIGCGKSTVAATFAQLGAAVIDADHISRSLTAANGKAMSAIALHFGSGLMDSSGALDRAAMRSLILQDSTAKALLESIVHPLVSQETARLAQSALLAGHTCLVFDVPLLIEAGARWRRQVDRVLVVTCSIETQIRRVMQRDGHSRNTALSIISAQATPLQRRKAADVLIQNDEDNLIGFVKHIQQIATQFRLSS